MSTWAMQVVTCWRQHLAQKSWADMLKQYGITGLLMAGGVLLPKLASWTPATDQHNRFEVSTDSQSYHMTMS